MKKDALKSEVIFQGHTSMKEQSWAPTAGTMTLQMARLVPMASASSCVS